MKQIRAVEEPLRSDFCRRPRARTRWRNASVCGAYLLQAVSGLLLVMCCGCVFTDSPISPPEDARLETDLLGEWKDEKEGAVWRISPSGVDYLPRGVMQCEKTHEGKTERVCYMWATHLGEHTFLTIPVATNDGQKPVDCGAERSYRDWLAGPKQKTMLLMVAVSDGQLVVHGDSSHGTVRLLGSAEDVRKKLRDDPLDIFDGEAKNFSSVGGLDSVAVRRESTAGQIHGPVSSAPTRSALPPPSEPFTPRNVPALDSITAENLVPVDAKALVRMNIGATMRSDVGRANMQAMLQAPSGQQAVMQLAEFNVKYGFNYLTDLQSATLIAPFPNGEPFSGLLLVAEGTFQRNRIEKVLSNTDRMPSQQHAGMTVYEQTGERGGGRFFFTFLSDNLFVAAMERGLVHEAIDRASRPAAGLPELLAAATKSVPAHSSISVVMDMSEFRRQDPAWMDIRNRASWFSISIDMGDPSPVFVPVLMRELGNSPRGVSEGGA